ncbi:hypothetical protein GCM10028796_54970 [Ramlibacter monticola]|uniref:Uncharacterized protein n=1 Tax=Ramlibacter monticola TaxID=1926872 RepID=A0A936Z871_9BURK|nr:hypothetical protein [Ramlibacter monticola]MBL0394881.1 hypothetical protein [Ramlibacter monticola]
MLPENAPDTADMHSPGLSLAAQRAGKALAKLSDAELLSVLGVELQRRGLQHLGVLPKPRAKATRLKAVEREQMLLALPVHDDMRDR